MLHHLVILYFAIATATPQQEVCEYTESGFHILLTPSPFSADSGRTVCNAVNPSWDYAIVPSENWRTAARVVGNCTWQSVGIMAYDGAGLGSGMCQFMQGSGVFGMGLGSDECEYVGDLPLLCQEMPVVTVTVDSSGVPMSKETVGPTKASNKKKRASMVRQDSLTPCQTNTNGLHLVMGAIDYLDAANACSTWGWQLARLSTTQLPDLDTLWTACQPIDAIAWLDALDNIDSGLCRFIYKQADGADWLMVSEGEHPCELGQAMAVCAEAEVNGKDAEPSAIEPATLTVTVTII